MNTHTFFDLNLRTEVELLKGSDDWRTTVVPYTVDANQAALLLCDVWDDHWCKGAARRVDAMAPRMQTVVAAARDRGIQIIHAPSDTMAFYEGVPQRERIRAITPAPLPEPRVLPDPPLPIDDSDGGCDSGEPPWHRAWSRQHPAIVIEEPDVISDSGQEIYSFLQQRGIDHLLIMGVHTNMCVLKRSFAIKQMTRWGGTVPADARPHRRDV